jgi:hypothetical protein
MGRRCDHWCVPHKEGPVRRRLLFLSGVGFSLVAGLATAADRLADAAYPTLNKKTASAALGPGGDS